MDYYKVLGVHTNASEMEIKNSFREKAKMYHPDANPNNLEAEENFRKVNEAYRTLCDLKKRQQYDKESKPTVTSNDYGDIFKSVFSPFGFSNASFSKQYELKQNAQAFDDFLEYYKQACQKTETLYHKKLNGFDFYLDPNNKTKFTPDFFTQLKCKIKNIISDLNDDRNEKLHMLKIELEKKNMNLHMYLADRNKDVSTLSTGHIELILKSMYLIDQINENLKPIGITIQNLLQQKGKSLINMRHNQLLFMHQIIEDFIKNNTTANSDDITALNFEREIQKNPSSSKK